MTTTATGRRAEEAAAAYLSAQGFKVIAQNWRTPRCEIDIIAEKAKAIYFVEVKYRRSSRQGSGLDYITPRKLTRLRFAAEAWMQTHDWQGACCLCAIEVAGPRFGISAFAEYVQG